MNIFNAEIVSEFFRNHYFFFLGSIFFGTFLTTWYIIPKIIWVSKEKQLMKPVIDRSVHVEPVPTFGGVAFFITLILSLSLIQALRLGHVGNHLIAACTILFMVGLKDDLVVSTARVKLIGQFLAISFLVFSPELELNNLHGFLGIWEIPVWLGYGLAAFILLATINSYNLIDGIDGLAAMVGIIIGLVYSVVFYFHGEHFYVLLSLSLVGMLCGYLRYNFSKGVKKIFMGDSGALVIGLLIGFLTLKLLTLKTTLPIEGFLVENRLLIAIAVLFIPFFDTTRSILIRLLNKRNPFEPDRNHTHHVLLDAGMNHLKASVVLGFLNILVVFIFLGLSYFLNSKLMSLVLVGVFAGCCWIFYRIKRRSASPENVYSEGQEANLIPKGIKVNIKRSKKNLKYPEELIKS